MQVNLGASHQSDFHGNSVYTMLIAEEGFPVQEIGKWQTTIEPDSLAETVQDVGARLLYQGHNGETGFREVVRSDSDGDWAMRVTLYNGLLFVTVAANSSEDVRRVFAQIREVIPEAEAADQSVPIHFWALGPHGPVQFFRSIEVPAWDQIRDNYATPTRSLLEGLMTDFTPSKGGQLILWHGEPGTGKTFALRAMSWEWRDWADIHYISDPEVFFGEQASYMLQILTSESESDRWRILLLEDSGELLAADAKERTGQGLSRLLNVVDGLIGQGLKILVLITTNDELRKLHPAVSRPGRCAAIVDFERLSPADIEEWADAHGLVEVDATKPHVVADLYAQAEGYLQSPTPTPVGFVR